MRVKSWQNSRCNTRHDEMKHLQQAFALSVSSHMLWGFPRLHPRIWSREALSNNRLAKGNAAKGFTIRGARNLAKQRASEEAATSHNRASRLCYYSPVPPTVHSLKLWGKEQRSLCQAQQQLCFMSGCREHHNICHHHWQTWPLSEGCPLWERFMIVEILLGDGVMLLLSNQCSKVPLHQSNDAVSAKLLHLGQTGFFHALVKIKWSTSTFCHV